MATDDSEREPVRAYDGAADESIVDLARQPIVVDWTKYVTALFGFTAAGLGLFTILLGVVDRDTLGLDLMGMSVTRSAADEFLFAGGFAGVAVVGIGLSAVFGAFLGARLDADDRTTFLAAGLSVLVGTFVAWSLVGVLGSVGSDLDVVFGDLVLNGVLAGLSAAVAAAGGVWASDALAPVTVSRPPETAGTDGAVPGDD